MGRWGRIIVGLALGTLASTQVRAATISAISSAATVVVGESFSVDLFISDLGGTTVGAFDLDLGYDPSIIGFTGYNLGTHLGDLTALEAEDVSFGDSGSAVNLAEYSLILNPGDLASLQPSDGFSLATISFTGLGIGYSGLALSVVELADFYGDSISTVSLADGRVTVQPAPIPEPTTFLLVGGGLACLACLAFRRKRASRAP